MKQDIKSILRKKKMNHGLKKIYHNLFPKLKREIFIKIDNNHYIYKRFYTNHINPTIYCFTQQGILWRNSDNMQMLNLRLCDILEAFYIKCKYDNINYIEKENEQFTIKAILTYEQLQTYK